MNNSMIALLAVFSLTPETASVDFELVGVDNATGQVQTLLLIQDKHDSRPVVRPRDNKNGTSTSTGMGYGTTRDGALDDAREDAQKIGNMARDNVIIGEGDVISCVKTDDAIIEKRWMCKVEFLNMYGG